MRDAEYTNQAAILGEHRRLGRFKQTARAAVGKIQPFLVASTMPRRDCGEIVDAEEIGCFLVDKIVIGFADDAGLGGAVKLLEAGIAGEINALRILQPDQVRDGLHQRFQKAALALKFASGLNPVTDVSGESDRADDLAIKGDRGFVGFDPDLPLRAFDCFLDALHAAAGEHLAVVGAISLGQIAWPDIEIGLAHEGFHGSCAAGLHIRRIDREETAVRILQPDQEGEVVQHGALVALTPRQFVLR